jgi:predicted CXXCH cytochrome family protein
MVARIDHRLRNILFLAAVSSLLVLAGCEQDQAATGPAAEAAAAGLKYVGYSDVENRNPTCVLCHEDESFGWRETAHANALTTLQASSSYIDDCRPCHTTGWDEDDNLYGADDAWAAADEDTLVYRDVQCETCHGPASQHNNPYIEDPNDVLMEEDPQLWDAALCGTCHEDTHHPYYEEWQLSAHAGSLLGSVGIVETNEECAVCHVAQSFKSWLDNGETEIIDDEPQPITCQACHTAHSNDNPGQLRLPLGQNVICSKCHNAEGALPGETVHHATWEVFTGTLDFEYPGKSYPNSPHTVVLAQQACVACHVFQTPYIDESNPAKTGHTFEPRLESCLSCHPGETSFDVDGVQTEIQGLIDQLQAEINAAGSTDMLTDSYKNALYILQAMLTEGSLGIHNTDYSRALLQDAIDDFTPTGSSTIGRQGGGS